MSKITIATRQTPEVADGPRGQLRIYAAPMSPLASVSETTTTAYALRFFARRGRVYWSGWKTKGRQWYAPTRAPEVLRNVLRLCLGVNLRSFASDPRYKSIADFLDQETPAIRTKRRVAEHILAETSITREVSDTMKRVRRRKARAVAEREARGDEHRADFYDEIPARLSENGATVRIDGFEVASTQPSERTVQAFREVAEALGADEITFCGTSHQAEALETDCVGFVNCNADDQAEVKR